MRIFILLAFATATITSNAQHLKIKNYGAGYRVFELDGVGNNPLTIAPFLKNPGTYQTYINNQVQYNGIFGNPGVQILRNYNISAEWYKDSTESRFWKKYTVQTGVFLSNRLTKNNMALENQRFVTSSTDTIMYRDVYSLVQKQQFLGVNAGINRRSKISKALSFITGFQLQGSIAFLHRYQEQWDSSTYHNQIWTTRTSQLPDLKGKNFIQWRMTVPIGLEFNAYKHEIFLRAEFDLGIVGDRYRRSSGFLNNEAHGYSLCILYQPKH